MKINFQKYFKNNPNLRPLIIAEISANHCGKKSLFLKSIKSAAQHGADLVKIQTYEPKDITVNKSLNIKYWNKKKIWKLYSKAQTPFKWHKDAFKLAKKMNINLFSTPFSERGVDFLSKLNVKLFKISSFEINDFKLIKKIASTRKPVIISTGMASLKEISSTYDVFKKNQIPISLLHCISSYPNLEKNSYLSNIIDLKKKFKCVIGLSDHTKNIKTAIYSYISGANGPKSSILLPSVIFGL